MPLSVQSDTGNTSVVQPVNSIVPPTSTPHFPTCLAGDSVGLFDPTRDMLGLLDGDPVKLFDGDLVGLFEGIGVTTGEPVGPLL